MLNYLIVLVALVSTVLPDLIITQADIDNLPFWVLYSLNVLIDSTLAIICFYLIRDQFNKIPFYALAVGWLSLYAITIHFFFWANEWIYGYTLSDIQNQINEMFYLPALKLILAAQVLSLLWGGIDGIYEFVRRKYFGHRRDNGHSVETIFFDTETGKRSHRNKKSEQRSARAY